MKSIAKETLQINIDSDLSLFLEKEGYSEDQIDLILAPSKDSEYGAIIDSIVKEVEKDHNLNNKDIRSMNEISTRYTEKWLKDNSEYFKKHIKDVI